MGLELTLLLLTLWEGRSGNGREDRPAQSAWGLVVAPHPPRSQQKVPSGVGGRVRLLEVRRGSLSTIPDSSPGGSHRTGGPAHWLAAKTSNGPFYPVPGRGQEGITHLHSDYTSACQFPFPSCLPQKQCEESEIKGYFPQGGAVSLTMPLKGHPGMRAWLLS